MEWKQLSIPDRSFKWLNGVFMACTSHLLVSTKLQFKTFNETNVCRKGINGVISRRDGYIRGNLWLLSWHWLCLCFSFFLGCSVGMVFCMSLPLCCVGKSVLGKVKGSWKEQTKKTANFSNTFFLLIVVSVWKYARESVNRFFCSEVI